jgi:hypothetical protein
VAARRCFNRHLIRGQTEGDGDIGASSDANKSLVQRALFSRRSERPPYYYYFPSPAKGLAGQSPAFPDPKSDHVAHSPHLPGFLDDAL